MKDKFYLSLLLILGSQRAFCQDLGIDLVPLQSDAELSAQSPETPLLSIDVPSGGGVARLPFFVSEQGDAIYQGDIVLGSGEDLLSVLSGASLQSIGGAESFGVVIRNEQRRWPNITIRYMVSPSLPDKSRVFKAIQMWEATGTALFEELTVPSGNYVNFVEASVCNSQVGMAGGKQLIKLAPGCPTGSVAHEIGHALGLLHEQSRDDRDTRVEVLFDNIISDMTHNFSTDPIRNEDVGAYCYESIMHYRDDAFAKAPGLKTIRTRPEGIRIGQRREISPCDINAIRIAYGLPLSDESVDRTPFEGDLELLPEGCESQRKCRLANDIVYNDPHGVTWKASKHDASLGATIQTGLTDGASIPSWAQPFIGKPFDRSYIKAAIVHDHYCYAENHVRSWRKTHRMFYDALIDLGVPKDKAKVMYFAVYLGGARWTNLVPGDQCGPDCINDAMAGSADPSASGTVEVFRKDVFASDQFIKNFEATAPAILNLSDQLTLTQIEDLADSLTLDDPYTQSDAFYTPLGENDPIFQSME